jgi:hypothetical protein
MIPKDNQNTGAGPPTPETAPKTVGEAVDILLMVLDKETMERFAGRSEEDLRHYHCTAGVLIRRQFLLESGNEDLLEDCRKVSGKREMDGKGASVFLLELLWKSLQKTRH